MKIKDVGLQSAKKLWGACGVAISYCDAENGQVNESTRPHNIPLKGEHMERKFKKGDRVKTARHACGITYGKGKLGTVMEVTGDYQTVSVCK